MPPRSVNILIRLALAEDIGRGDVTSWALIPAGQKARAPVIAKVAGVVAGTTAAVRIFRTLDRRIVCRIRKADGRTVKPGEVILTLHGPARSILTAERTALNLLGHLSGVATLTAKFVQRVRPYPVKILDTRKTLPGLRTLEKQAVRAGGGQNHRMGLDDAVLIKTNHLKVLQAAISTQHTAHSTQKTVGDRNGSVSDETIREAIRRARARHPQLPVEIELTDMDELRAALVARPDVILLDNWPVRQMKKAVALRTRTPHTSHLTPLLEVSGGVTLENVRRIAAAGVDRISIGRLTHSAPALDVSLQIVGPH
ncbi:MAG: carboxylating nicotinate-nucleotide diphosphorylase [Candidatus Omnitrophica bacterium]|nr:carboxylating nicotinate-nucleotide diphosphorylase [Candidatus Omnitrophota bacterium]